MAILRVPPGRAGRLWLRHRLDIAVRGSDLLERKLRILREEEGRLRARAHVAEQEWQERVEEAEAWLLRADLVGGAGSLGLAVDDSRAEVVIDWTMTMGVHHPSDGTCVVPAAPLVTPGSAALVQARTAYQDAACAAVRHAAAQSALSRLSTEVSTTAQRVRALRRRWIPRWGSRNASSRFRSHHRSGAPAAKTVTARAADSSPQW